MSTKTLAQICDIMLSTCCYLRNVINTLHATFGLRTAFCAMKTLPTVHSTTNVNGLTLLVDLVEQLLL